MLKLREYLDVIIPRGGEGLIKATVENATVPVIETGAGVCHTYVDRAADPEMAAPHCVQREGAPADDLQRARHAAGAS